MRFTVTAGHGGKDAGAPNPWDPLKPEAVLVTELRDIVARKLRDRKHEVTTDGDRWVNLPLVHALTLVPGKDAAIELHMNSHTNAGASGVEVVALPEHAELARTLARKIAHTLRLPVRGYGGWIDQRKTARGRIGFVRLGGLVVEVCFLSNPFDYAAYEAKKWLVASAIVEALTSEGQA